MKINKIKSILTSVFGFRVARIFAKLYKLVVPITFADSELNYIDVISKLLKMGDTVVDIGANVGLWSLNLSRFVSKTGKVYAFEPVESTFNILKRRTRNFSNIIINKAALSDTVGTSTIAFDPVALTPPDASILNTAQHIQNINKLQKEEIVLNTLDNYFLNKEIKIDFIKIDVEGHEFNVIKGGINTISKYKPVLFIEILREYWVENSPAKSQVAELLISLGYKINQVHLNEIIYIETQFNPNHENFLFTVV